MHAKAAEIQVLLEGIALPASKGELLAYAREQDGHDAVSLLQRIPDREYGRLDDVGEALVQVQPSWSEESELPHTESDLPPGGAEYVNAHPTPGTVRQDAPPENPPQKAIEQQTKTQNEQKERQEKLLGPEEED
jgi:Protein of unknown function (DUF2795)